MHVTDTFRTCTWDEHAIAHASQKISALLDILCEAVIAHYRLNKDLLKIHQDRYLGKVRQFIEHLTANL